MLRSTLSSWREFLTPVSHKSTFQSTGQITPEEFVQAGEYLCHMFPTWKWNEVTRAVTYRDFLPREHQFLVTRKVPCGRRAEQFTNVRDAEDGADEDGWVIEKGETSSGGFETTVGPAGPKGPPNGNKAGAQDIDELLESFEIEEAEEDSDDIVAAAPRADRRYYDLYIAYSTSYRVPKMYLVGFQGDGAPLTPEQMFEDISPDYRTKTATIEKLPFLTSSVTSVSIHPCKHANVMRVLMGKVLQVKQRERAARAAEAQGVETSGLEKTPGPEDDWEDVQEDLDIGLRVDQYLIVFLKFMASVTPGIEHDYTMEGW
ncbi:LAMI_0C01948g1_1 [Lachancea mirantina]|uniref:Autophagy-related protein 3 n=1 Tax=Lachancea mirantina TaxID=1230905 RepID=A0A1G4J0Q2_9SACH|nr:LAMI_0C01948g1_1 [Lachancea mirantina]